MNRPQYEAPRPIDGISKFRLVPRVALVVWTLAWCCHAQGGNPFDLPVAGTNLTYFGNANFPGQADLNNDGFEDIIVVGGGVISASLALGNNAYAAPVFGALWPAGPPSLTGTEFQFAKDVNGDGFVDVASVTQDTSFGAQYVVLSYGLGNGLFSPGVSLGPGYSGAIVHAAAVGPIGANSTGVAVTALFFSGAPTVVTVYVIVGGAWVAASTMTPSMGAGFGIGFDTIAGDFNGDGIIDLIGNAPGNNLAVLLGTNSAPWFGPVFLFPMPHLASGTALNIPRLYVVDINGDGCADIAGAHGDNVGPNWANSIVGIRLGSSQTVLGPWITVNVVNPLIVTQIYFRDFDRDGVVDLVTEPYPNAAVPRTTLDFHRGLGGGTFLPPISMTATPLYFGGIVVTDSDLDGDMDVVCISTPTSSVCVNRTLDAASSPLGGAAVPTFVVGTATPGNSGFYLGVTGGGGAIGPAVLGLSLSPTPVGAPPGVHLNFSPGQLVLLQDAPLDALGNATFPIPLPPAAALSGVTVYGQIGVFDPSTPLGYGLTRGRRIVLW